MPGRQVVYSVQSVQVGATPVFPVTHVETQTHMEERAWSGSSGVDDCPQPHVVFRFHVGLGGPGCTLVHSLVLVGVGSRRSSFARRGRSGRCSSGLGVSI